MKTAGLWVLALVCPVLAAAEATDGSLAGRPLAQALEVLQARGVKVIFSPLGVIADDVIRDLVDVEPSGRTVVVVTSDVELARDVAQAGARPAAAAALVALLARDG